MRREEESRERERKRIDILQAGLSGSHEVVEHLSNVVELLWRYDQQAQQLSFLFQKVVNDSALSIDNMTEDSIVEWML